MIILHVLYGHLVTIHFVVYWLSELASAMSNITTLLCFCFLHFYRAFAVVASALGIPSLLPFLKAVCRSKKSWQARHTGIKIVQQIAILMGCAILPHLKNLVEIIENGKQRDHVIAYLACVIIRIVYELSCVAGKKIVLAVING